MGFGMSQQSAEALALEGLTWLISNEELLPVFMGSSGVSAADLRHRAAEPEFLGAVLDFLLMDDAWVTAFCDSRNLPYQSLMQARQMLPGGSQVNWT